MESYFYYYNYYYGHIFFYSHSNPPFIHSYNKPSIKITKNKRMITYCHIIFFCKPTLHGYKKETSKSKTRNNTPIKKNLIDTGCPILLMGLNPHSYAETFSLLGNFSPSQYETPNMTADKRIQIYKNHNIGINSTISSIHVSGRKTINTIFL